MSFFESAPKQVSETCKLTADFLGDMASGVTISSGALSHSVYSGASSSISHTAVAISGTTLSSIISGGTAGVIYQVNLQATLSDGQVLRQSTLLAVVPNTL